MSKALILGGGGLIGKSLSLYLWGKGVECIVLTRTDYNINSNSNRPITGEFSTWASISPFTKGVTDFYYLLPAGFPIKSLGSEEKLISNFVDIVDGCIKEGVDRFFFASSSAVYGETGKISAKETSECIPLSKHGKIKLTQEDYLRSRVNDYKQGFARIARISNPYGFHLKKNDIQGIIPIVINRIHSRETIKIRNNGESTRDYIYIDDLIYAIDSYMKPEYSGPELLNLASGTSCTIKKLIGVIEEITELKANVQLLGKRKDEINSSILDNEQSVALFGKYALHSLSDGIRSYMKNYIAHFNSFHKIK